MVISDGMANSYMKIFFKIFKAMGHMPHYKMMIGRDFVDLDPVEVTTEDEDLVGEAGGAAAALVIVAGAAGDEGAAEPLNTPASLAIPIVTQPPKLSAGVNGSDPDTPF